MFALFFLLFFYYYYYYCWPCSVVIHFDAQPKCALICCGTVTNLMEIQSYAWNVHIWTKSLINRLITKNIIQYLNGGPIYYLTTLCATMNEKKKNEATSFISFEKFKLHFRKDGESERKIVFVDQKKKKLKFKKMPVPWHTCTTGLLCRYICIFI